MKNQVLSIEQMQKLKELGVDTSKASMAVYNIYAGDQKEYDILAANGAFAEKQEHDRFGYGIHNVVSFDKKPVFTLQDIVELLTDDVQKAIVFINNEEYFVKCYEIKYDEENVFKIIYFDNIKQLLNACCEMLIWVAENGYLTSK